MASSALAQLGPFEQLRAGKLLRRIIQLGIGLIFYGISTALMVRGSLGLAPWDALHLGIIRYFPVSFGLVVVGVSSVVLLLWIPLREIPGLGTIANAVTVGPVADITWGMLGTPEHAWIRFCFTLGGVSLCGLGSAMYIGAQLGRGPRDGLMTGLHRVTGLSLGFIRTGLEISVLLTGILLGGFGFLGIGTLLFAFCIGPLTQLLLPWVLVNLETKKTLVSPDFNV